MFDAFPCMQNRNRKKREKFDRFSYVSCVNYNLERSLHKSSVSLMCDCLIKAGFSWLIIG